MMMSSGIDPASAISLAVQDYQRHGNLAELLATLDSIASAADPDALVAAAEPYRELPEVSGPIYERVVAARPTDARALVILANAYWLSGRGPDVVGDLASRAIAADPSNRGAWHLWALTEADLAARVARWQQVTERFPADDLALANLADNAASLASTEDDDRALRLAIRSYQQLHARASHPAQRDAVDAALRALRGVRGYADTSRA
jgi:hypothetical protein